MAHKLSIFRGLVTFKSNIQKIWGVLVFLSIVTAVEVALGIIKPSDVYVINTSGIVQASSRGIVTQRDLDR